MKIAEIADILNRIAPETLQESWDNSGIQIRLDSDSEIRSILTCIEISRDIVDEAIREHVDMIVTHHPLIFGKLASIDCNDITGQNVIRLISAGISVYSSHTSFDSALNGTNQYLAERLGLSDIEPMIRTDTEGCGMGRTGTYIDPQSFPDFLDRLGKSCGRADIRIAGPRPGKVSRVCLCTGAGSEFIPVAQSFGADVYVTGDVKYHDARLACDLGICTVDAGHYGTEVIFAENMAKQLSSYTGDRVKILVSSTDIYPFSEVQC